MRYLSTLVLTLALTFAAGCSAASRVPQPASPGIAAPPLTSPPTFVAYQPGEPVTNKDLALAAALKIMEDPSFTWTQAPTPMLVEQLTYEQAYAKLGFGEPGPDQFITTPRETPVWFVIVFGKWTLQPMGPPGAAPVAYEGCLLTILTARDGSVLSRGDSRCPGKG